MVSIAQGTDISNPGWRTWLAACPWVPGWLSEDSTPPAPKTKVFTSTGAGWRSAKAFALGNAQAQWTFRSTLVLGTHAAATAAVQGFVPGSVMGGILEWWRPALDGSGLYYVYRAPYAAVTVEATQLVGCRVDFAFLAVYGTMQPCGSSAAPGPDYLTDAAGNHLTDLAGNRLTGWSLFTE